MRKTAKIVTPLQPHQQRAIDKLKASGGLLLAHGVGSGKTLTSIAAAEALGLPIEAITPAPLQANYAKEMQKHTDSPIAARIRSYEGAVKAKDINRDALVVMDEAHRARNSDTSIAQDVAKPARDAKARLLMTGTAVYNNPLDLANLLNTAAGRKVLPDNPGMFNASFIGNEDVQAPLWDRLKGKVLGHSIDNVSFPKLINKERLVDAATGYVDVHKGGGGNFPRRIDETYDVPMSKKQLDQYDFHEGKMPWYLKAKIRAGLPLDKAESKDLNTFQGALRQVSNTPRPYLADMTDDEELEASPKIRQMVDHILAARKANPNHRGVAYSNYIAGGLNPLSRALDRAGVKHHLFTGDAGNKQRAEMVKDYNEGRVPMMLLSGAGSEGLDLKGTRSVQIMEPHWNDARLDQVIGRGIRYKSHEHLPEDQRDVKVQRYFAKKPGSVGGFLDKFTGKKPEKSIEEYLREMSKRKTGLSDQIMEALQEASDRGPLKKRASVEMDEILRRIGDASVESKGRKHEIVFKHPTGITMRSPYDENFVREKLRSDFANDPARMGDQLHDDFFNAGYAALGSVGKKNLMLRNQRAGSWAARGGLLGIPATMVAGALLHKKYPHQPWGSMLMQTAPAVGSIGGGTLGWHLGKATYSPMSHEKMLAQHQHPLLVPPKAVKEKFKLEVKE